MHINNSNQNSNQNSVDKGFRTTPGHETQALAPVDDLSGAYIATMEGAFWHQAYHYHLVAQPYAVIYHRDFYREDGEYVSPATGYLVRATKYLMGRMDTAFFAMPRAAGDKIASQPLDNRDAAFAEYISQHVLRRSYLVQKGFPADRGEALIAPIGGYLVAFCQDADHRSDEFDLLVVATDPLAAAGGSAAGQFLARVTHSDGFGDIQTSFYEVPRDQGEAVLEGKTDEERAEILFGLARENQNLWVPGAKRWRILLGADRLHDETHPGEEDPFAGESRGCDTGDLARPCDGLCDGLYQDDPDAW